MNARFPFFLLLGMAVACAPDGESPQKADAGVEPEVENEAESFCGRNAGRLETADDGSVIIRGSCVVRGRVSIGQFNTRGIVEVTGRLQVASGVDLEGAVFLHLRRVGGGITAAGNRTLAIIGFPELVEVGGEINVVANFGLLTLQMDSLESIGTELIVLDNPDLPACDVEDTFAGVAVGGSRTVGGNCETCCAAE